MLILIIRMIPNKPNNDFTLLHKYEQTKPKPSRWHELVDIEYKLLKWRLKGQKKSNKKTVLFCRLFSKEIIVSTTIILVKIFMKIQWNTKS